MHLILMMMQRLLSLVHLRMAGLETDLIKARRDLIHTMIFKSINQYIYYINKLMCG